MELALRLCSSKFTHLQIIWARLGAEAKEAERLTASRIGNKTVEEPKSRKMTPEETSSFLMSILMGNMYELDHEDFILHSKILLDHVALLVFWLLNDKNMPSRGFSHQRKYLFKAGNVPYLFDEEYARFVRDRTKWYEPLLKAYRDDFVEHNASRQPFGTLSNPGRAPRPIRTAKLSSEKAEARWKELNALRDKYLETIPGLVDVPLNHYELLDAFEENHESLSDEDLRVLMEIRQSVGSKLPDPIILASHVLETVRFVNGHFLSRLLPG